MDSVVREFNQLCSDYVNFWAKEKENFTACVEILKCYVCSNRNLRLLEHAQKGLDVIFVVGQIVCTSTLTFCACSTSFKLRTSRPHDPNHDVELTIIQTTERLFTDRVAPIVATLGDLAQRATKILQEIDRLIFKNKAPGTSSAFERDFPNVYPALETIYLSITTEIGRVMDAVDNLNYTEEESFQSLNVAIESAFQSIEELDEIMIRLNITMSQGVAEI